MNKIMISNKNVVKISNPTGHRTWHGMGARTALAALLGVGLVLQAFGETVLFSDTFTVSANKNNVNFENTLGRQSGGTLGVVNYAKAGNVDFSQVGHIYCPGSLLLVGQTLSAGYVSPDHNFIENPGLGSASFIRFKAYPVLPDGAQIPIDWVGITLGTSLAKRNTTVLQSDGFGIIFQGNGSFYAFDGTNQISSGTYTTVTNGYHAIDIRVADFVDGNPWDGTNSTLIAIFADGNASPFFCYTKTGAGYTNNYMTLMDYGSGTGFTCHAVDDLQVGLASWVATNLALKVDFQNTTTTGAPKTQSGFVDFDEKDAGSATYLTLAGKEVRVTLSGLDSALGGFYNRGGVTNSGNLAFADIYNDFAFKNGTSPQSISLTLSGPAILPRERYTLTFYSYDDYSKGGNHSVIFAGTSGTIGSAGPLAWIGGVDPTSNTAYTVSGVFKASASGTVTVSLTDTFSGATDTTGIRLNAIEIKAEPLLPRATMVSFF